jgi:hypothetical protein
MELNIFQTTRENNCTTMSTKGKVESLLQPVKVRGHSLVTAAVSTSGDDALHGLYNRQR